MNRKHDLVFNDLETRQDNKEGNKKKEENQRKKPAGIR